MADNKIRVLIVDDHPIFCDGVRANLDPEEDIEVAGFATNGTDAIRIFREKRPDVTLLDVMLGSDMRGTQVLEAIRQEFPEARIIMLSVRGERDVVRRSMDAGAKAYLSKTTLSDDLVETIRKVHLGWVIKAPEVGRKIAPDDSPNSLTRRELEVLRLTGQGMRDKEIAYSLKLKPSTINTYMKSIFRKLSVHDRTKAVMVAIELGYLDSPQAW